MDFSGKGPGLEEAMATMTKQSPEGIAFTFPPYHPVPPLFAADDAIYDLPTQTKFSNNEISFNQ